MQHRSRLLLSIIALAVSLLLGPGVPIANAASDTQAPRLVSVTQSTPGPVSPPSSVNIAFTVSDPLNVRSVSLQFISPTGQTISMTKLATQTGVQVASPVTRPLVFDSLQQIDFGFLPSGTYAFSNIAISDWSSPNPNQLQCTRAGAAIVTPPGSTAPADPCPSASELEALDFVISNPNGDSAGPELTSIDLPTGSHTPGDVLQVEAAATDNSGAGVHSFAFFWVNLNDNSKFIQSEFSGASGSAPVVIAENTPPGTYQLDSVIVRDRMQYSITYRQDGSVQKVPAGISGPVAPHGVDISETFTVINPNADTATPVLDEFERVTAANVTPGSEIRLNFDVDDEDSGFEDIFFEYDPPSGLPFVVSTVIEGSSNHAVTAVPLAYPPGDYVLAQIRVTDEAGNEIRYFRGGGLSGVPQGVLTPPAQPPGFAAMFAQADFSVSSTEGIVLTDVFPRSARANSPQGITIQVTGSGFTQDSVVNFGPSALQSVSITDSVITATVPSALLAGSPRVVVLTVTKPFSLSGQGFGGAPFATSLEFEITEFAAADVNADGCVELSDVLAIRHTVAANPFSQPSCAAPGPSNFDVNRDGSTSGADALYALRVLAGILPE